MLEKYHSRDCRPCPDAPPPAHDHELKEVFVQTGSLRVAAECLRMGADRVYYAPETYDKSTLSQAARIEDESGKKPYIVLPPFLRGADMRRMEKLLSGSRAHFGGALAGNFSQAVLLREHFADIVADYTCNISNRRAVRVCRDMGFTGITLSAELSKRDLNGVKGGLPTEVVAYGYLPPYVAGPSLEYGKDDRPAGVRIQNTESHRAKRSAGG